MNIDTLLIHHCAPTLAGLKPGALLCFHRQGTVDEFKNTVDNIIINSTKKDYISVFYSPARHERYCTYIARK